MRQQWVRLSLVTSVAALMGSASACHGNEGSNAAGPGGTPSTTASATAPSSSREEPRECTVADLLVAIEGQNSAKSKEAAYIVMANTSSSPCTLSGYPKLELHTRDGPMPTFVTQVEETVATVTLRPGQVASILIVWDKYEVDDSTCPLPAEISITLPNQAEAKTIPWLQNNGGSVCGGKIAEWPIAGGF
jgi:Protein of unknown function (DUF4232)